MKRSIFNIPTVAVVALLATCASPLFSQADKASGAKAPNAVDGDGQESEKKPGGPGGIESQPAKPIDGSKAADTGMEFKGVQRSKAPAFKAYVFWAYGVVCLLLFLFFVFSILQSRKLEQRVNFLEERFEEASGALDINPAEDPGKPRNP